MARRKGRFDESDRTRLKRDTEREWYKRWRFSAHMLPEYGDDELSSPNVSFTALSWYGRSFGSKPPKEEVCTVKVVRRDRTGRVLSRTTQTYTIKHKYPWDYTDENEDE